uniref:Reverse transcriptase domain-containing protein n=1 Tax=Fagus sylvatica TaxID=28930 RepID=A0A2N9IYP8_FAGSY
MLQMHQMKFWGVIYSTPHEVSLKLLYPPGNTHGNVSISPIVFPPFPPLNSKSACFLKTPPATRVFTSIHGSSSTTSRNESLEATVVEPQRDLFCDKGSVDEVGVMPLTTTLERETSGWAMELRDGRRLTMPSFPLTENEEIVSEPSLSLVNSDFELVAVVETDGEWEDEALWVEPLAISMPGGGGCWWAFYVGFEDRVMKLLSDIEAASGPGFTGVSSGFIWGFSGVYGPNRGVERCLLWEELAGLNAWFDRFVVGRWSLHLVKFFLQIPSGWIFILSIFRGPFFQYCAASIASYSFRLFPNFTELWVYAASGTPSFVLAKKLKALKFDLRRWNREVFGNINHRKDVLLESIQALDAIEESRSLSPEENAAKFQSISDFEDVLLLDEITWGQKSRATWLWEGDKNTRFFHRVANSNHRFNTIGRLMVNGVITTDQDEIDGLDFSSIDEEDNIVLDKPFTEEVLGVLKDMAGDKAPGPDGYSMAFFQRCWDIVKNDVMAVFREFYTHVGHVPNVAELAGFLGCQVSFLPMSYLGLPPGAGFKKKEVWNNEMIISFTWLTGRQACSPIPHGGLGIHNMLLFNKALLGKWLWRYVNEIDSLWRRVVDCKYGSQRRGDGAQIRLANHTGPFQDWELEMGISFMEFLYSLPIRRDTMDSMWWHPSTKGIFECGSRALEYDLEYVWSFLGDAWGCGGSSLLLDWKSWER